MADAKSPPKAEASSESVAKPVELPQWECQLDWASVDAVTVGTPGNLTCTGGFASAFVETKNKTQAKLIFPEKVSKHTLKILQVKQLESTRVDLVVTSHTAGDFKDVQFKLANSEGALAFNSNPISWTVASVLDPQQKPEPVGSYGPYTLSWPLWLLIVIGLIVGNIVFFSVRKARAYKKHRELVKELERHGTALTPYQNFNKSLRAARKLLNPYRTEEKYPDLDEDGHKIEISNEHKTVEKIREALNEYITRIYIIPCKELSRKQIIKKIKKELKFKFADIEKPLGKVLREFDRANKTQQLEAKDVEQIAVMSQELVDKIDELYKKNKRRTS